MRYNPNKHNRRSIRLKGYDYSQAGLYFVTICIQNRAFIFGNIQNGILNLNEYGKIAFAEWQRTEEVRSYCIIHEFIIMPNHIHGIIEIKDKGELKSESTSELKFAPTKFQSPSQTIGSIIRGYKIATIKKIKDLILERELEGKELKKNTGESKSENTGESKSENTDELKSDSTGELQFAPTRIIKSLNFKIWQRNYYEHIIRNERAYNNIANYIINNPKKWEEDKFYK